MSRPTIPDAEDAVTTDHAYQASVAVLTKTLVVVARKPCEKPPGRPHQETKRPHYDSRKAAGKSEIGGQSGARQFDLASWLESLGHFSGRRLGLMKWWCTQGRLTGIMAYVALDPAQSVSVASGAISEGAQFAQIIERVRGIAQTLLRPAPMGEGILGCQQRQRDR